MSSQKILIHRRFLCITAIRFLMESLRNKYDHPTIAYIRKANESIDSISQDMGLNAENIRTIMQYKTEKEYRRIKDTMETED